MVVLLLIGFVAGVITAVSPCVLPVLPIVLAGSASGGARRPYAIVAGLVASFTAFTLAASVVLSALGLPQDALRDAAIALLFLVAASLIVPGLGLLLERPFVRLSRGPTGDLGGGLVLGLALGLVFVPCAGPVLATVSVLAAERRVGVEAVLLTLVYAAGAGSVLLAVAAGGQRVARRLRAGRAWLRPALGVVIAAGALAIVFGVDQSLQTSLGSYTSALQRHTEASGYAERRLRRLTHEAPRLPDYGAAPDFDGIAAWLNTPAGRPLSLRQLRGHVVLVDFWTYSCINCLRTLPHLRAWYATYRRAGFEIVGVHTPEFAFEHVLANVRDAVHRLHVTWPVALDNDYATWTLYRNEYWPAEYLIDRAGRIRDVQFGEGAYSQTEHTIRRLLGATVAAPRVPDATPSGSITPETYLGAVRLDRTRYAGSRLLVGLPARFAFARAIPRDAVSLAGGWRLGADAARAGRDARLRVHFRARDVYLVAAGRGRIRTFLDGRPAATVSVDGDRLYTLTAGRRLRDGVLELRFTRGLRAYSLTFG